MTEGEQDASEPRMSASSQVVLEIASYSDDGSSSVEAPEMDDDCDNDNNEDANDDEGNDHATTTENGGELPKAPAEPAQEQRVPSASRVASRLEQAKRGYIKNTYRTTDLLPLQREYGTMKRALRSLLDAAIVFCEATKELGEAQTQVRTLSSY